MEKKRSSKKTTTALWNAESVTILSTMEYLTRTYANPDDDFVTDIVVVKDGKRVRRTSDIEAVRYLQDRLGLNPMQVQLLTCVFYHQAAHPNCICDIEDLSKMLKLHPLRTMQYKEELDKLEDFGYLVSLDTPRGDNGWRISKEAAHCLQNNEAFSLDMVRMKTAMEFLCKASQYVSEGMRFDQNNSIRPRVKRLMRQNTHLPVVRNLQQFAEENYDMWFMLLMMTTLGAENDPFVGVSDLEQIIPGRLLRGMIRTIKNGTNIFVKKGYVQEQNMGGLAGDRNFVLTNKAWEEMIEDKDEVAIFLQSEEEQKSKALVDYKSLHKKELFFSGKTKEQIDRLGELLKEEKFANIRQALSQRGLPTGFCCLFYGSPGTGKTELVQQLAIATERDMMQVDLSTLRDKYVGESEKRIKGVFDTYRALVKQSSKAPILFFNEADGIFGNRMENTQHSVDKMENAIQNIILQEMEQFEGIMICTTNLTTCMDKAFDRRFLFKIEFERPTNEARKQIWQSLLVGLNDAQATELADKFDFSGGQIQNISRKQIIHSIFEGSDEIDYEQVKKDCQSEQVSRQNGRKIGF
jgi:Cdc6-like AAA superfamily ATPase